MKPPAEYMADAQRRQQKAETLATLYDRPAGQSSPVTVAPVIERLSRLRHWLRPSSAVTQGTVPIPGVRVCLAATARLKRLRGLTRIEDQWGRPAPPHPEPE